MKPLALDTPLHVEQRWLAGLRTRGALWRLQRLVGMTPFSALGQKPPRGNGKPGYFRSATDLPWRSVSWRWTTSKDETERSRRPPRVR